MLSPQVFVGNNNYGPVIYNDVVIIIIYIRVYIIAYFFQIDFEEHLGQHGCPTWTANTVSSCAALFTGRTYVLVFREHGYSLVCTEMPITFACVLLTLSCFELEVDDYTSRVSCDNATLTTETVVRRLDTTLACKRRGSPHLTLINIVTKRTIEVHVYITSRYRDTEAMHGT